MYLTHPDLSKYWAVDIEANGLDPDTIWVVCAENILTGETWNSRDYNDIRRFFHDHRHEYFTFHNGIGYDRPGISKVLRADVLLDHLVDTLILSYLYHPQAPAGHSLDAWGERLGIPKVQHDEWDRYTPAMLHRCQTDVKITKAVFLALTRKMRERGFSERSCWIEHHFADVIRRQKENGFRFDTSGARELYGRLRGLEDAARDNIRGLFPRELRPVGTFRERTRKDGKPFSIIEKHRLRYPSLELNQDGTYTVSDWFDFNIGSPKQRVDRLLSMGWSPEKFTKTGQPKTDEESIKAYVETLGPDPRAPQVLAIADWLVYNGRANMVNTWLNEVKDDYIHGSVFSCGAASRRCTHSHPNTANIPSNEAKYGPECRGFWKAREGRVLLGYDAKSAQMRLFGHYLRNPEATRFYLGEFGDPHAKNGLDAGIPRGRAKNCFYALIFGAQDPRLGLTAGGDGTPLLGKRVRGALYKNTPGLEGAMREAEELYKEGKGWLPCLDGGFVRCPSPHSALNYLIQPAEAVLMKLTAIYLDQKAQKRGIDHLKVGDIHDEAQHDCLDRATAEALGEIAVETMPEAGEELGITVKMEASYKIGLSWADTH